MKEIIMLLKQNLQLEDYFNKRYISPNSLYRFLNKYYSENIECIGYSVLNQPIYKVSIGSGEIPVLLWTQMHGNESTGTLSCIDLLKFLKSPSSEIKNYQELILKNFTLDIILMLNPDGAQIWTRENIMGIDINRDYRREASLEMRILKEQVKKKDYQLAFNLHDQKTIYGIEKNKPASLSFLSPSFDIERTVNDTRKKSMGIIKEIYQTLSYELNGQIARYSDEYYPRSVGDNFQAKGIPTLLFEGGHYLEDYYRFETRKYFSFALIIALTFAASTDNWAYNYEEYFKIPENKVIFYDIIYRNVKLLNSSSIVDIGIMYEEWIRDGDDEIVFIAKIEEIGDLKDFCAHLEIDAENRTFKSEDSIFPKLGVFADFELDEYVIRNGKKCLQM